MAKRAIITGITGQDGFYMALMLLSFGYDVAAIIRPVARQSSGQNDLTFLANKGVRFYFGDMLDTDSLMSVTLDFRPHEIYNFAAQSHVGTSFKMSDYTMQVTGLAVQRWLEAILASGVDVKFYQASSSELWGKQPAPQSEQTPFAPQSPYANAKLLAYHATKMARERGLFAVNGILCNHESPRRGKDFVTQKIIRLVADVAEGRAKEVRLGNLDAKRDWGFAPEYVWAAFLMLQEDKPDDFVIGTEVSVTVRHFLERVCKLYHLSANRVYVPDVSMFRPLEVPELCADITKARNILGWYPTIKVDELIDIMVNPMTNHHITRMAKSSQFKYLGELRNEGKA